MYTQDAAQDAVALARDAVEFVSGKIDELERQSEQARETGQQGPQGRGEAPSDGPDGSETA